MNDHGGPATSQGSRLSLSIWHPDCWTLQVTEDAGGGLFGHGVYGVGSKVKGRFTVYGDTTRDLEALVGAIEDSSLTDSVWEMDRRYDLGTETPTPGNAARSLLVEYDERTSINDAIVSNGFIPDKPVWIHDGREYWTVIIDEDREQVRERLEDIRQSQEAEVEVQQIVSHAEGQAGVLRTGVLSERQREIFEYARDRGYYNWPREATATDLADDLGISKTTFLEHLRKAESKLLEHVQ